MAGFVRASHQTGRNIWNACTHEPPRIPGMHQRMHQSMHNGSMARAATAVPMCIVCSDVPGHVLAGIARSGVDGY
jgi:hypothetical protein